MQYTLSRICRWVSLCWYVYPFLLIRLRIIMWSTTGHPRIIGDCISFFFIYLAWSGLVEWSAVLLWSVSRMSQIRSQRPQIHFASYIKENIHSKSSHRSHRQLTGVCFDSVLIMLTGRGRHWNFDPLQCLGPRPEILDRYISLSCLRWLPTACHERLAYFHWPQWVTWLVTWWVTWSRSPDAGRHIGKFSLWTTLLRFSRSAQISLFSNFTKLGQLFFDNIFFGLTS